MRLEAEHSESPWCSAGSQDLKEYNVIWKTRLGSVKKDYFEINAENASTRIVIVPGPPRTSQFSVGTPILNSLKSQGILGSPLSIVD